MYWGPLLCLFFQWHSVYAAILSIDYGTEWTKAALVKPGIPLEIVLTKDTKRKEQSVIAFKGNERLYGGDAANLASRFPQHTYPALKTLLGQWFDSDAAREYSTLYPAVKLVSTEAGSIAFEHGTDVFTVEELVAMEFINMRRNAELMADGGVRDTIFTVPPHFNDKQRTALMAAAQLAGLRPIELLNDGLAVALDYAKSRTFNSSQTHAIFDMGAGSTSATVVKFESKSVKDVGRFNKTITEIEVLGSMSTTKVSGNVMSDRLYKYLLDTFSKTCIGQESVDFQSNHRAHARLIKEATRIKQILSANNEAVVSLESLHNDKDFKHKISRTLFEELTADLGQLTSEVVKNALNQAHSSVSEIQSVILHGGAARVPFVQSALLNVVSESQIARNVNADEAAVMGAVFRGAGLSGSFRVKELIIRDFSTSAFVAIVDGVTSPIFDIASAFGSEKNLTLTDKSSDFDLILSSDHELAHAIAHYEVRGVNEAMSDLAKSAGCKSPMVIVTCSLDYSGLVSVPAAHAICEVEDRPGMADKLKGWFASKETDTATGSTDKQANTTESLESSSKTSVKTVPLSLSTLKAAFIPNAAAKEQSLKKIAAYEQIDADRIAREAARNGLEAYIYKLRDLLENKSFNDFATEAEITDLKVSSAKATDWMYDQGETASLDELLAQKKSMSDISDRVSLRQKEARSRPSKIDALQKQISTSRSFVKSQLQQISEYNRKKAELKERAAEAAQAVDEEDLAGDGEESKDSSPSTQEQDEVELLAPLYTESELNVLAGKLDHTEEWLSEQSAKQENLAVTNDPVLLTAELERRTAKITEDFMYLLRKVTYADQSKSKSKPKSKSKAKSQAKSSQAAKTKAEKAEQAKPGETAVHDSTTKPVAHEDAELPVEGEAPRPGASERDSEEPAAPQPEDAADIDAAPHDEL